MSICKGLVASAASQEVETSSPRNLPSKGTFRSLEISLLYAALYLKTFILKVKTLKPLKSIHQHLAKQLPEPKTSPSPFPSFNAKDAKDFSRLLCFFSSLLACFASQEAKQPKTHEFSLQLVHRKKCQESRTSSLRNSPTNVSTKKQWKPQAREIYPAVPHTQSLNKSTFRSLEISLCSSLLKNLHVYHFFQLKGGFVSPNLLHSKLYSFKMLKPCILCQDFQALEIYPSESYQKILQNLKKNAKTLCFFSVWLAFSASPRACGHFLVLPKAECLANDLPEQYFRYHFFCPISQAVTLPVTLPVSLKYLNLKSQAS